MQPGTRLKGESPKKPLPCDDRKQHAKHMIAITCNSIGRPRDRSHRLCVCEFYIAKPMGKRAMAQFTTGVANHLHR